MKKFASVLMGTAVWATVFSANILAAAHLDIVPDKPGSYKIGEKITFTVTAWDTAQQKMTQGTFKITLRDSGGKVIKPLVDIDLSKQNPAIFTTSLDRPGFLLAEPGPCTMPDGKIIKWSNKPYPSRGGAPVEPEKIRTATGLPDDFHEFWQKGIGEFKLAAITVRPEPAIKRPGFKVYRLTVTLPDKSWSMDGFLSIPEEPGKYPAVISAPGAGFGTIGATPYVRMYAPAIELFMNLHNFPTALNVKSQKEQYDRYNASFPEKQYFYAGSDSREKYIFRNAWLSLNRAVDYILTLEKFDGKNLAAVGSSQGGGTALALTYLNKRVSCVVANVPALCDHSSWQVGRYPGWPQLHKATRGRSDAAAPYFDAANFARFIRVPALISAGYVDKTCPPASVYAMYNNLQGPKEFFAMPREGHVLNKEFKDAADRFLRKTFFGDL